MIRSIRLEVIWAKNNYLEGLQQLWVYIYIVAIGIIVSLVGSYKINAWIMETLSISRM